MHLFWCVIYMNKNLIYVTNNHLYHKNYKFKQCHFFTKVQLSFGNSITKPNKFTPNILYFHYL